MRRRVGWLVLIAMATAIACIGACRQLVGITDNPPTNLTSTSCGLPYGTSACGSCAFQNCCSQSNECAKDPTCEAYASCVGPCNGDPTCIATCEENHPNATPAVSELSACIATSCASQCGLQCGGLAGYHIAPDAAAGCQACLATSGSSTVCQVNTACAQSIGCDAVNRCFGAGNDQQDYACEFANGFDPADGLEQEPPDGGDLHLRYDQARSACATPCEVGGDWSCVGHVSWPSPQSPDATYHFWVRDLEKSYPISGVTASVCNSPPSDDPETPCAGALVTGMTNDAGFVELGPFPIGGSGNAPGLNSYLQFLGPSLSLIPYYYYWGFPLSQPQVYGTGGLFTTTDAEGVYQGTGVTQHPNLGVVIVSVFDCQSQYAPGVVVTLDSTDVDAGAIPSCWGEGFVTSQMTTTTDYTGAIGCENVPTGAIQLTATPIALGKPSSTVTAYVRAGAVTGVLLYPTPNPNP
jgi:hypothetical protein